MKGSVFVLGILGLLAVFVAIVVGAFVVFEPEGAPCADGELATNRIIDGVFENRMEEFEEVEDAEAFICRSVPEITAEGWSLTGITARRNVPIEFLVQGEGLAVVTLTYENAALGSTLSLDASPHFATAPSYFESTIPPNATSEPLAIDDIEATAYRFGINPDAIVILWQTESLEHQVSAQLTPAFTLEDVAAVLATLD